MTAKLGLAIFDFDGVIADSQKQCETAYRYIFTSHDKPVPFTDFRRWYNSAWEQNWLENGFSPPDIPRLVETYFQQVDYSETKLFDGMAEQLAAIAARLPIAIASTTPQPIITTFLEQHRLSSCFSGIYSPSRGQSAKIDLIRRALTTAQVAPNDAIMIGDTAADIQPAKELGCRTIGVSYGWYAPERMVAEEPTFLVAQPTDLAAAVFHLLEP